MRRAKPLIEHSSNSPRKWNVWASDQLVDDLADAILDGTPIDWAAAESRAEGTARPLVRHLRVLAAVAALARSDPGRARASLGEAERTRTDLRRRTPAIAATVSAGPRSLPARDDGDAPEHWGHLRLIEQIGRGAFGDVYRAWDTRLDREVALKLLPAGHSAGDRASTIIHEGRLLARVRHLNVVTIYGAEQIADRIGLWMEFVRGHTLEQILDEGRVVSVDEVVGIGLELCRAMSAVHGAGLLHRDIKTHNVMRAEDGRIVLMDFGTGKELADEALSDLAGTPLYLAPEVLNGQQATVQSDLYSLGVLLYHLVTGSYPVHAQTVQGVRRAHARGERTAVRTARVGVPRRLARLIERAIDPDPTRRYQSAETLGAELSALTPRARTARLAYAAGLAAVSILTVAAGWEITGRQMGSSRTPSVLFSGFAGLSRVAAVNISPAQRPIIAVLPFKNLSAEPDSEYFVDGLTDEIIQNLAVLKGLEVRSRTSSFVFKGGPRNLPEIGKQLGVNLVLEGSVLRAGNRLRINAKLVQVDGDVPLWAEPFDREVSDIFAIQEEISRAIVDKLRLTVGPGRRRENTDFDAYDLYVKARALVDRRGLPNARKAAELFQRAIAIDPGFAPAYAGLANAYAFMSFPFRGIPYRTAYPIMRPAAVKALQLDPLLSEAHAAMGWVYSYEHDWTNAERAFQQAIGLNPSLTQSYTSYSISTLQPLRKYDEALRLLREAARYDPLSLDVQREIGQVHLFSGRYAEAVDAFRSVVEVEPDFPFAQAFLAKSLAFAGKAEEAIAPLELDRGSPWLAYAYVATGRRAEAEKLAAEFSAHPYRLTVISAALGDTRRATEALEQAALSEPHRVGRLLIEPELAALRTHPRVAAVRKKFGLP
jgi:serine/threonine protein kinase/tetratricopeptide (TPR) repeat protein